MEQHEAKIRTLIKKSEMARKQGNYDLADKLYLEIEQLETQAMQAQPTGQRVIETTIDTSNFKKVDASKNDFDQEAEIS